MYVSLVLGPILASDSQMHGEMAHGKDATGFCVGYDTDVCVCVQVIPI